LDAWLKEHCHIPPTQLQLPKPDADFVVAIFGAPKFDIMAERVIGEPDLGSLIKAVDDVINVVVVHGVLEELCW
jgi:hypothetical protein